MRARSVEAEKGAGGGIGVSFGTLLGLGILAFQCLFSVATAEVACTFPKQWAGRWFQSGVTNNITISSTWMDTKGRCIENEKDKYIVEDKTELCYRCISFHSMHPNVLQYKETYCLPKYSTLDKLCADIPIDTTLVSMFRMDAAPQPCPLKNPPFTFTYSRNFQECDRPVSHLDACTDPSRLRVRYQACPDVKGTEATVEELDCLANWKEGSTFYMVGKVHLQHKKVASDEDRYRCFVYEETELGYRLAQSGDATCNGLTSATVGSRNMNLTRERLRHVSRKCQMPDWLVSHSTWQSLNKRLELHVRLHNATLRHLRPHRDRHSNTDSQNVHNDILVTPHGPRHAHLHARNEIREETIQCQTMHTIGDRAVQIVAHVSEGCDSGYVCLRLYQRDSHVIEMQQSERTHTAEEACKLRNFDPLNQHFVTFTTSTPQHRQCPYVGRYAVTNYLGADIMCTTLPDDDLTVREDVESPDSSVGLESNSITEQRPPLQSPRERLSLTRVRTLAVGCTAEHSMEFHSHCEAETISAYSCHGSWEDNGTSFAIALPMSRTRSGTGRRFCFVYREVPVRPGSESAPGEAVDVAGGGAAPVAVGAVVIQSSAGEACHRHTQPHPHGTLHWTFSLTPRGQCASSTSHRSAQLSHLGISACIIFLWLNYFLNCGVR